jgi:hypothetical protein
MQRSECSWEEQVTTHDFRIFIPARTILMEETMKLLFCIVAVSCVALFAACSSDTAGPGTTGLTGTSTAVGTSAGTTTTATIGPEGGSLFSTDSTLELIVPANSLSANTTISIEPITNNAPLGIGNAYRLKPEGLAFASPATLRLHYSDAMLEGTTSDALHAAYQDASGIWQGSSSMSVDNTAKTVSASITHFSDWSFAALWQLTASRLLLNPGQSITLTVLEQQNADALDTVTHHGTVPLGGASGSKRPVDWEKKDETGSGPGEGTLTPSGGTATYAGPQQASTAAATYINATLHFKTRTPKMSVYVALKSIVWFSIDGRDYVANLSATAITVSGVTTLTGAGQGTGVGLIFPGTGKGNFSTNDHDAHVTVSDSMYTDLYVPSCTPPPAAEKQLDNAVDVSVADKQNGIMAGTFAGTLVIQRGTIKCAGGGPTPEPNWVEVPLRGQFRVLWISQ